MMVVKNARALAGAEKAKAEKAGAEKAKAEKAVAEKAKAEKALAEKAKAEKAGAEKAKPSEGAAAKSPPLSAAKAGVKESVLTDVAKAAGVSKEQAAKVLDHLGLGEKLSGLDAKLAKDALNKVSAASLKIGIKLDNGAILI